LKGIQEGVQQANILAELGFWKVYLYIFALIDARELNLLGDDRPHFNEIKYKINLAIGGSIQTLQSRIGVFAVDLVQTTDTPPTTFDQAGGHLLRKAGEASQSHELTEWVSEQLLLSTLKLSEWGLARLVLGPVGKMSRLCQPHYTCPYFPTHTLAPVDTFVQ
jgi:hypothetical protein